MNDVSPSHPPFVSLGFCCNRACPEFARQLIAARGPDLERLPTRTYCGACADPIKLVRGEDPARSAARNIRAKRSAESCSTSAKEQWARIGPEARAARMEKAWKARAARLEAIAAEGKVNQAPPAKSTEPE